MTQDFESLYRQIGRLIETMPQLDESPVSRETHQWLGRLYALVMQTGNLADAFSLHNLTTELGGMHQQAQAARKIEAVMYRAFAVAELKAPPGVIGSFIPVGSSFDAFTAVARIFETANREVFIVDPYLDKSVLEVFARAMPEKIALRLLADEKDVKPTLQPAAAAWIQQFADTRPLKVRLAAPRTLHDRAIFVDGLKAWALTQSFNHLAARAHAEIIRADDTAALKIAAYNSIWDAATVVY